MTETDNYTFLMYVKNVLAIGKMRNTLEPQQKDLQITFVSINFLQDIFFTTTICQ